MPVFLRNGRAELPLPIEYYAVHFDEVLRRERLRATVGMGLRISVGNRQLDTDEYDYHADSTIADQSDQSFAFQELPQ